MLLYIFCDKSVNDSAISKTVLIIYRFGNWVLYNFKIPIIKNVFWIFYKTLDLLIVKMIAGADIPAECKIGKRLFLAHGAKGIILHPKVVIGENVKIYHQVTIGSDGTGNDGSPLIGNSVFIGVGAKLLGRITINDNAKIGANAVVLQDIPINSVAVGIPAKIILKKTKQTL